MDDLRAQVVRLGVKCGSGLTDVEMYIIFYIFLHVLGAQYLTSTAQHSTYGRCVMQCMCLNQPTLVLVSIIRQEYSDLRTRQRQTQQPPTLPPPLLMALGTQAYPRNPQLLVSPFTQSPPQSSTDLGWPPDKPVRACPPYGSFLLLCLTFPCLSSFFFSSLL